MLNLEFRYQQIRQTVENLRDFPDIEQAKSRDLFDFEDGVARPRCFDVWTCLAGLPMPEDLTQQFTEIAQQVRVILPANVRFYPVIPSNYHWEVFIIKRPTETIPLAELTKATDILKNLFFWPPPFEGGREGDLLQDILSQESPLKISYGGFLVTPDGTLLVQGFGEFDRLRQKLRSAIPFASPHQSQLGHISLGRILDPLGEETFSQLKQMVKDSQNQIYGEWNIREVKYVHERQWYMEDREIIGIFPLNG